MERILSQSNLVLAWLAFMTLSPLLYALLLVWSVKRGQFDEPERGRVLPLENSLPEDGEEESAAGPGEKNV